jgi:hypothetical protein
MSELGGCLWEFGHIYTARLGTLLLTSYIMVQAAGLRNRDGALKSQETTRSGDLLPTPGSDLNVCTNALPKV